FVCCVALLLNVAAAGCQPSGAAAPIARSTASAAPIVAPPATASARASSQPAPAMPGKNVPAIKVDTVGYPLKWRKLAIFNVAPVSAVVKDEAGKVAYVFKPADIVDKGKDPSSLDPVWQLDFSALQTPGRYFIEGAGAKSDPFAIGSGLFRETLLAALKHFYFQRCRSKLEKPYATWKGDEFTRASPCHVHDDVGWDMADFPQKKRKWHTEAGWHDAGNYSQYVPSEAPSAQALLIAFERHPELFKDADGNIPESGNNIPDILDEAKWGLTWILSMQEPESGAFRGREAVYDFNEGKPQDERKTVWVAGIGTASTAKAASVLAVAARVYKKWDAAFAARCEKASRAAWAFLEQHPERVLVDGKGSRQTLWDDGTEYREGGARFIAAVEVWRSFRLPTALASVQALLKDPETSPQKFFDGVWADLSRWGLTSLAFDDKTPPAIRSEAKSRLLLAAETVRAQIESKDGYRCASKVDDYYWGHNSNLLEKAYELAIALQLDPSRGWLREALRDQWHWILGRNPNGYSMVTRIGKGPERLYHEEWSGVKGPVPGYLLGGPNASEMGFLAPGAPAKALLWDNEKPLRSGLPPHSLWHSEQSDLWDGHFIAEGATDPGWWAITEPDIYYNANLVLVAAELQD
ncbi:MAG TPA: glycoside hydrolase family 9 protein, partial [Polyangiaceae bacterium]|nr:glycoside hydrolase family 9 protein [Polyangiaceae bacterium]